MRKTKKRQIFNNLCIITTATTIAHLVEAATEKMPGIYLSDPPATETGSPWTGTRSLSDMSPAITSIMIADGFQMGINTCGFTSESTSRLQEIPLLSPGIVWLMCRSNVLVWFRMYEYWGPPRLLRRWRHGLRVHHVYDVSGLLDGRFR